MARKYRYRKEDHKNRCSLSTRRTVLRSSRKCLQVIYDSEEMMPAEKWNLDHNGTAWNNFISSGDGAVLDAKLRSIKQQIDSLLDAGTVVTADQVKKIVEEVVYAEQKAEEQRKKEEEKKRQERKTQIPSHHGEGILRQELRNLSL